MPQIRLVKRSDFRSIVELTNQEDWGFGLPDLERMKALQPKGCLVATVSGGTIGFTTAIAYGRDVGWIGNVVVSKQHRGAGIGSSLVQTGINHLLRVRVKKIGLLSYPENVAMYERLGFDTTGSFDRLSVSHGTEDSTEGIGRIPLRQILSLDKRAFEADRSKLLRRLYREFPKRWSWVTNIDGISGYSLVKQYQDSSEIGPLICEDMNQESIGKLLSSSVALTDKWPLEMTVPESNSSIIEAATRHGFRVERKGFVMSYARLRPIAIPASVGAFGFLDKG